MNTPTNTTQKDDFHQREYKRLAAAWGVIIASTHTSKEQKRHAEIQRAECLARMNR